eukprot:TRINITY_DN30990_c0_g1_i1.p1 TRINITY_DN30990_c0_g1~~TRINITY_DN30990_c0_g1_i1.p1  ORF type:complete len:285 (-),score=34.07 TRINITY_DN30990_c0_g1_i1:267-1121(-)
MIDPPAAGKPNILDSEHLDYRLGKLGGGRKLQCCQWFAAPTLPRPWEARQEEYGRCCCTNISSRQEGGSRSCRNGGDKRGDIEGARPKSMPCVQMTSQKKFEQQQFRCINPLEPVYDVLGGGSVTIYPQNHLSVQQQRQRLGEHVTGFEVHDIPYAKPQHAYRTRKQPSQYNYMNYSDVGGTYCRPQYYKVLSRKKDPRKAIDVGRLTYWGKFGDTGRFSMTKRVPTDPVQPIYHFHGQIVKPHEQQYLQAGAWALKPSEWNKTKDIRFSKQVSFNPKKAFAWR